MPRKKKEKGEASQEVGEEIKIAVNIAVKEFRHDESKKELEFPSSFSNAERKFIHLLAQSLGLKSRSKGKGASRYLTLYKKENTKQGSVTTFDLTRDSRNESHGLLQRFPVTPKERQELQPRVERRAFGMPGGQPREIPKTTGRLNNGIPQVPAKRAPSDLDAFRQTLPVYAMRDEIMKTINRHRVSMISGETGSGKTTQIPQFILDECFQKKQSCRILCTQPRRLSALSIAERVASERGESIGQTVGYQIRLESRVSPKTLLTFCTNGVLLRTLMAGDHALQSVTHVIIDEVHERDRFSDFLLIQLREILVRQKHLRVILMSAALDTELFIRYFNNCPLLSVPGKIFDVEELFLEDALKCTGYTNDKMKKFMKEKTKLAKQTVELNEWYKEPSAISPVPSEQDDDVSKLSQDFSAVSGLSGANSDKASLDASVDVADMSEWLMKAMDSALGDCWLKGKSESFDQLMHLILNENVSVDYAHSETSATPLMLASGRGNVEVVERLLSLGANPTQRASNDMTPLDWATKFNQTDVIEILQAHITNMQVEVDDESDLIKDSADISAEDRELLQAYQHSFDDERVDLNLILALLTNISDKSQEGAILVFLPGYDDIVALRDILLNDDARFADSNHYQVYTLHSSMQSSDQKKVFRKPPSGVRKIVLSTNIAETSVTINDVVFVLDSGKVKEKSFDALTSVSMLKSNWISKASAKQRKGRAGRCRPGMCFHLMSRVRYKSLPDFQTPEILRLPLQELCLHTKLLAPLNSTIADFLSKAPDPPASLIVKNAVQLLKAIDAIDNWEDMTELGHHLADLPLEPRLGKMVLYSIVLKCLDPVLTIVCALAYRDPFILPNHPSQKRAAMAVRKKYAATTFSDHMALLRAFQAWQRARSDGWEKAFCQRNFLSQATMEMIVGMRTQLLGQLRASGFVRARGPGDIRDLNTNSENWAVVKASLCAGMYPNIMKVDRKKNQLMTQTESKIRFHPNSVIHETGNGNLSMMQTHLGIVSSLPTDWLIYEEMTRFHHLTSVRCATAISPLAIALFCGPSRLPQEALFQPDDNISSYPNQDESDSDPEDEDKGQRAGLKLDDWIVLKADTEAANLALHLRQKWHTLFLRRMRMPAKPWAPGDEAVLRTIVKVLSNEEQSLGLQQPVGIGQRPKPMAMDHFNNTPPRKSVSNRFGQQPSQVNQSGTRAGTTSSKDLEFRPSTGSTRQWNCASPNKTKQPPATKQTSTLNASAPPWQGRTVYHRNSGVSSGMGPGVSGGMGPGVSGGMGPGVSGGMGPGVSGGMGPGVSGGMGPGVSGGMGPGVSGGMGPGVSGGMGPGVSGGMGPGVSGGMGPGVSGGMGPGVSGGMGPGVSGGMGPGFSGGMGPGVSGGMGPGVSGGMGPGVSSGINPSSSGRVNNSASQVYGGQQGPNGSGNPVRFFIVKCNDPLNIELSHSSGLWCVSPSTGQILSNAFKTSQAVFLIFSVQGSGQFQGFGRMTSDLRYTQTVEWRDSCMRNGGEFGVQWVKRANVSFGQTRSMLNAWNDNQRVQLSRDGQELDPSLGESLLQLWAHPTASYAGAEHSSTTYWGQESRGQQDPQQGIRSQSPQVTMHGQNWPVEGRLQPLAHSSPAYEQGPAAYCKKGVGPSGDGITEDYQNAEGAVSKERRWSVDDGSEGGITTYDCEYQSTDGFYASQVPYNDGNYHA
ncbi:3'-5' RNA helicase YTHDC2-like isoform X2 [Patiria miniata]|uniref:RNA helicase n=1 Tax=Patiria miniata TaxID=46514 RepID=A0A914BB56_PATMI|nr:3'-5' RNA helicase YTHDC2-like isoform X2 [Patiria miniata]